MRISDAVLEFLVYQITVKYTILNFYDILPNFYFLFTLFKFHVIFSYEIISKESQKEKDFHMNDEQDTKTNIKSPSKAAKTALITGASRGIGRAIALKFAREGYNLIINCAQNASLLESLRAEVRSYGAECISFLADVGDMEQCRKMFTEGMQAFSGLDVLINNAGISYIGLLQEMGEEDWDALMRTNLYSVFHCSKLAIPLMLRQGRGKIINISSVWGKNGASCEVAYSASKGAVNAFTRALGKELAPSNIQVNAVACGAIETDMNAFLNQDEFCCLSNEIPAGRLGQSAEVAELVWQLASSTSYLNAQIINLDGAWQ